MRILFLGDVVGRSGRDGIKQRLPELKERLKPDVIVVNAENAAGGKGLTEKVAQELYATGADCLTTGNHVFAQKELAKTIGQDPRLLRPLNFNDNTSGQGYCLHTLSDGRKILIVCVLARLFMAMLVNDPFAATEKLLENYRLGKDVDAIFIDFHGEATSEKVAFGHFLDGRASAVIGSHTHIPTADEHILPKGTAYQTDAGMCGDFDSVIGVKKNLAIARFTTHMPTERFSPAEGEATLCGTFIVTDDKTGLAQNIARVQVGGFLPQALPVFS